MSFGCFLVLLALLAHYSTASPISDCKEQTLLETERIKTKYKDLLSQIKSDFQELKIATNKLKEHKVGRTRGSVSDSF